MGDHAKYNFCRLSDKEAEEIKAKEAEAAAVALAKAESQYEILHAKEEYNALNCNENISQTAPYSYNGGCGYCDWK
jgi:hypothetical protein